jgi:peptidoglycan/xylan/chitin deacetylase (PgdA/CDA1 family)
MKIRYFLLALVLIIGLGGFIRGKTDFKQLGEYSVVTPSPIPTIIPSPTPSPTPKPLTFMEMNARYGPCINLPTLMYHHVQDPQVAKDNHQTSISVDTETFREQMVYLKGKGYQALGIQELVNFFNNGTIPPKKSVILTFDDGYEDFYFNAYPILKENGFLAIMFLPTGLMNNYGYLNWSEISEMAANGIYFGNHTWSHKSVAQQQSIIESEITTADTQLTERNLDNLKIFAYPYGSTNSRTETFLTGKGYSLAFTTKFGSTLCDKQKYELPRLRIGNKTLSLYGL